MKSEKIESCFTNNVAKFVVDKIPKHPSECPLSDIKGELIFLSNGREWDRRYWSCPRCEYYADSGNCTECDKFTTIERIEQTCD